MKKLFGFERGKSRFSLLVYILIISFAVATLTGCPLIPQQSPIPPQTDQPPPGAQPERNVEDPPITQRVPDNELALRVAGLARVDGVTDVSVVLVGTTAFVGVELEDGVDEAAITREVEERIEQESMIVEALVSDDPEIISEIDSIRSGEIPPSAVGRLFDKMQAERQNR